MHFQPQKVDFYQNSLIFHMTDSKLRARGLGRGREGSEQERSIILMNLRRVLNTAGAKSRSASHERNIKDPHEGNFRNPHESNFKIPHESSIKNSHENSIKNSHESSMNN